MASIHPNHKAGIWNLKKPWRARVKLEGVEYYLGAFETKEEADAEENAFRNYQREADNA